MWFMSLTQKVLICNCWSFIFLLHNAGWLYADSNSSGVFPGTFFLIILPTGIFSAVPIIWTGDPHIFKLKAKDVIASILIKKDLKLHSQSSASAAWSRKESQELAARADCLKCQSSLVPVWISWWSSDLVHSAWPNMILHNLSKYYNNWCVEI